RAKQDWPEAHARHVRAGPARSQEASPSAFFRAAPTARRSPSRRTEISTAHGAPRNSKQARRATHESARLARAPPGSARTLDQQASEDRARFAATYEKISAQPRTSSERAARDRATAPRYENARRKRATKTRDEDAGTVRRKRQRRVNLKRLGAVRQQS